MKKTFAFLLALVLAACAAQPIPPPAVSAAATEQRAPVTILASIDGFRPDYLDRGVTPTLSRLAAEGVTGPMRPAFPSKTFPNHWTLVTGLVPDRHGIVGNTMLDARRPGEKFTLENADPFWWNAAEPLWVTAEKAGIRTATMFWPGANVAWGSPDSADTHGIVAGGTRPEDWQAFDINVSERQRVDAVIDWLRRPATSRPRFITLYFDAVDAAGHDVGPNGAATTEAVAAVDRAMARLMKGLAALGQPANLVIVSDHGMAATSSERVIALDRLTDAADYDAVETGSYASLAPVAGHEAEVERALLGARHRHMSCWPKRSIPARLHYGANPRVPAILCLADSGWLIQKTAPAKPFAGGNHGYDNQAPDMLALFIANGPAFRGGQRLPVFDNVDVAPLLRDLIGLPADAGLDGTDRPFQSVLKGR